MPTQLTFSSPSGNITIAAPQWGYESRIVLAMNSYIGSDGSRKYWDNTSTYDTRLCKCSFLLSQTDAANLVDFMADPLRGRVGNFSIAHGYPGSGFYPFGPDLGDGTGFLARKTICKPSGQKHSPWKWWNVDLELAMVSKPSYSLPAEKSQGGFQFGTITGLRYPQSGFDVESIFSCLNLPMLGGGAQSTDRGPLGDTYTTAFTLSGNQSKIAAVVNQLATVIRGNSFDITTGTDYYAFGIQHNLDGAFICKLDSPEIVIRHLGVDQFELNLKLVYEGTDA